ncbi:hypothetical protein PR003_g2393 [Phytophthora rubi]|uniref:Uncharacterized protein n=1 Tax=Phytophthora rubi TaxID=129364 RepID=A0A6A3JQT6_9STRA|nr:hypothetical protein PR002_g19109 [Phytophthora rubi]KAE9050553.1 hypothetical protein PR001_g2286 [Phytophthora rubi]KAE9356293.1 hypothetical protein PR003_g2393 [Phytophthora rubi]
MGLALVQWLDYRPSNHYAGVRVPRWEVDRVSIVPFRRVNVQRGAQPLFLSSLFQLACDAASSVPSVFHVECESIRSGMSVASSYEPMCAQQHSDTLLINSAPPQECHDLDFVAHVAAQHLCWCTSTTARA